MSEAGEKLSRGPEGAPEEALYLRHHHHHLHAVVDHATRLLQDTRDPEQRAGILHDLLEELYRHEDRLRCLRQEGLLSCTSGQLPSLVPVSTFMTAYLSGDTHSLGYTCRALRPFAARAARCPVFSYVVERLGLLQEPPPHASPDHLALRLRYIHAVFRGAPGAEVGPLGAQHSSLAQRYAASVSRQRYRVRLEEGEQLRVASRVLQWLEETYVAALADLRDARLALSVVREAHAALLAVPCRRSIHLQDVLRRALAFFVDTISQLPAARQATPTAPPRPPQPVMADIVPFFPGEFFSRLGCRLLEVVEPPHVLLENYLRLVCVMARVFGTHPELQTVPRDHRNTLLAALAVQDDCSLLQSLQVALHSLRTNKQPEAVRAVCLMVTREAVLNLKKVWASAAPREPLHEGQPLLWVTQIVREVSQQAGLHAAASPEDSVQEAVKEEVQEAYRQVHAAFIMYLQRAAARHKDLHTRRYILLKNLLLLGTYAEAEQHLDLPAQAHTHT
ncbi:hypothetical protein E2C01_066850 [Portunus trituberculatus]|uniref:Uncharacterized protein n=1 Tax=Portunus trituberculatus TaxID=210409 RepID=A0A5B7HS06_PORTR|nr:hypothetical protein [Portunus trituberculatus]